MASTQLTVQNLQIHESLVGKRPPSGRVGGSKGISSIAGFKLSSSVAPTIAPSGRPASCRAGTRTNADGSVNGSAMSECRTVLSSRAANVLATLESELQEEQLKRTQLEERLSRLSQIVESMKGK